jgi:hypothetical protein
MRHVFLMLHPVAGYVLLWEDDTQNNSFDVYIQSIDDNLIIDLRIGDPLRSLSATPISDTSQDTSGFTCLVDTDGIVPVWQSDDEINSDILGIYAVAMTSGGAFQAQEDPNTPLIKSGRYLPHQLNDHAAPNLTTVAMVWAGGDYFHLRAVPVGVAAELHLVRTNADGLPDTAFGLAGNRLIDINVGYDRVALSWANTRLIAANSLGPQHSIFLFDGAGAAVNRFGINGVKAIREPAAATISPQLGHEGTGNNFRVLVAYGRQGAATRTIRYAVLDQDGNFVVAPRDLAQAEGTARQGWFHYVPSDTPRRSITAWHRTDPASGNMAVFIRRYQLNGTTEGPERRLTTLAGDSQNAVIAPRPVNFEVQVTAPAADALNRNRREYGVAWQYRPDPTSGWEIRFSRLNRDGTVAVTPPPPPPPAPPPPQTHDVQVVQGFGDATNPQLVWHSNGYGLAWLDELGGQQALYFTILDQNGARVDLRPPGAAAPFPAPNHRVSEPGSDVKDFQLVWNGRSFRIAWTEVRNGRLRHKQTAIAVPRQAGQVGYDQPYHHPTSALIRATLINGATNMDRTALPNLSNNPNHGYGWGRVNLRQSLAPRAPVTFYARDDGSVASGRTVQYRFRLPPDTRLLRTTLAWTDPPGVRLVNNLNLRLTAPDGRVYVGNRWRSGGPPGDAQFSDPLPAPPPANPFEGVHNVEQIVIPGTPTLPPGNYLVEVIGGHFGGSPFQQFPGQPFALVFVGSGEEIRFGPLAAGGPIPVY